MPHPLSHSHSMHNAHTLIDQATWHNSTEMTPSITPRRITLPHQLIRPPPATCHALRTARFQHLLPDLEPDAAAAVTVELRSSLLKKHEPTCYFRDSPLPIDIVRGSDASGARDLMHARLVGLAAAAEGAGVPRLESPGSPLANAAQEHQGEWWFDFECACLCCSRLPNACTHHHRRDAATHPPRGSHTRACMRATSHPLRPCPYVV